MSDIRERTIATPGAGTVCELFEHRAARAPQATAVVCGDQRLTYGELDDLANRLAQALLDAGIGPEGLVALHFDRGVEMVAAMLAVHKAGGAYVPLDPVFPEERLQYMLADAGVKVVLSDRPPAWRLPDTARTFGIDAAAGRPAVRPEVRLSPESLAYVIYTSGSTGRPKGVQIPHGALVNFLASMAETPGFGADDVLVAVTTLSFDIAGLELFLPLVTGGRVVVAPKEVTVDGVRLAELLATSGATVLQATPATWKLLLQAGWSGGGGLRMFCGGEALPRELAERLLADGGELWNLYGPTETTVWSLVARVRSDGPVLIGRPIAQTELHVVDPATRPVTGNEAGEILLGGAGLARGYRGRPALTAERFVPDPFGERPGARLYRTGDLGRFADDGELTCLGRTDHQVKVRGFRIELGEIEAVLLEHPEIRDAAVVAAPTRSGEKRLLGFVVPRDTTLDMGEAQKLLASRLPEYMRPAVLERLDALPLTPNGKIDRRALMERPMAEAASKAADAPRTPTEELVVDLWAELVEVGSLGIHDDFFALGGHSLLAGQMMARLRRTLDVELPPSLLFEHPTPARFARALDDLRRSGAVAPPLVRAPREAALEVSYAQERLWVYDQLEPGSNAFNIAHALRLEGKLSVAALEASLEEVVRRHEILRTRVVTDSAPRQVVDPVPGICLRHLDLSALPAEHGDRGLERCASALAALSFDLARGPLFAAVLVRRAAEEHVLCLTLHHILADGWSLGVLVREITALYAATIAGSPSPLPEPPVQYADFAVWQRGWLRAEVLEEALAYWTDRLGKGVAPALLPTDRPSSRAGGRTRQVVGRLAEKDLEALRLLGEGEGATLFMTLLAGIALLIHRVTGSERVVTGSMNANRTHEAVAGLIGFFANVLPLATRVAPRGTFRELLGAVREAALGAYAHQDTPFEKIVERVRPGLVGGRNAVFQVMVIYQNVPLPPLDLPDLLAEPYELADSNRTAAFDLTWIFVPERGGLHVALEYDAGLFEQGTLERLLSHYQRILADGARDPDTRLVDLPRLDEAERGELLDGEGRLWLTAAAAEEASEPGNETPAAARQKAEALQSRVASRRSKLSAKQLALLKRRLRK